MDGVIIDSEPLHEQAQKAYCRQLGFTLSAEEKQSFIGTSSKNMWQTLKERYRLTWSVDELCRQNLKAYFEVLDDVRPRPIPGVAEVIAELQAREIQLILASSSERESIDKVLDMFGITNHFSHVVSGAELIHSKPHPETFLKALSLSQTASPQAVVIEDSTNGLKAARAAKIFAFGYDNPNSPGQDMSLADEVLTSFQQDNIISKLLRK